MHFARVYYSPGNLASQVEVGDLYFSRGRALLVLTWKRKNGERIPDECVELDPDQLKHASSNGTIYRYEGSVRR